MLELMLHIYKCYWEGVEDDTGLVCECCYCGECAVHTLDFTPVDGDNNRNLPIEGSKAVSEYFRNLKTYITSVTTFAVQLPFFLTSEEMESSTEIIACSTSKEPPLAVDSFSAKGNIPRPLQTFHPFPRLHPELCLDIWDLAFAEQCPDITEIKEERWKAHQILRYTAKNSVPTLLSINYESLSVMLSKAFPLFTEGKFTR
jgi:hypothetical protein